MFWCGYVGYIGKNYRDRYYIAQEILNCMALAINHNVANYDQVFSLQLNKSKGRTGRKEKCLLLGQVQPILGKFLWFSFTDPTPVAVGGKHVFVNAHIKYINIPGTYFSLLPSHMRFCSAICCSHAVNYFSALDCQSCSTQCQGQILMYLHSGSGWWWMVRACQSTVSNRSHPTAGIEITSLKIHKASCWVCPGKMFSLQMRWRGFWWD